VFYFAIIGGGGRLITLGSSNAGLFVIVAHTEEGAYRKVDLAAQPQGTMFEPSQRRVFPALSRSSRVSLGTLVWSNGADSAPETLRDALNVSA